MRVGTILDLQKVSQGIWLSPFNRHPISNEVERLRKAGAQHIEFTTDLLFSNDKAAKAFAAEKVRLRDMALQLGLTYSFHLPTAGGFCTGSCWKQVREGSVAWLREFVEETKLLEPLGYVMHPQALADLFDIDLGPMQDGFFNVRRVLEHFAANVVIPNKRLAVSAIREFLDPSRIFMENSESVDFYLLEDFLLPSGYSVCMDVGHLVVQGLSVETFVRKFKPILRHVHLHDVIRELPPGSNWRHRDHRPLGTGCVDIGGILKMLRDIDFKGAIVIEDYFQDPMDSVRYLSRELGGRGT